MTDERYNEIIEFIQKEFDISQKKQCLVELHFCIRDEEYLDEEYLKGVMETVKSKFNGEEIEFIDKLHKKLTIDAKPWVAEEDIRSFWETRNPPLLKVRKMINISENQINYLKKYMNPEVVDVYIQTNDLGNLLIDFDDAIIEFGMDEDQEITPLGVEMQKIYDQIFNQN